MADAALTVVDAEFDPAPASYAMTAITPMAMIGQAVANGASIETMAQLMGLQERWEANQARKAFDAALAAAKAEIPVILKNRLVDFPTNGGGRTTYRHEDLGEIARTVDPILAKHGLSYRFQTTSEVNLPISVTCVVSHRDGHSEKNTLSGPRDDSGKKNALQQMGSTISYLQRYTLKAALGLAAAADDDGRASGGAPDTVSDDDEERIKALIVETKSDIDKFLETFKVESIADLPAKDFPRALAMLETKKAQQARQNGGLANAS
jgi:hypothetical protein